VCIRAYVSVGPTTHTGIRTGRTLNIINTCIRSWMSAAVPAHNFDVILSPLASVVNDDSDYSRSLAEQKAGRPITAHYHVTLMGVKLEK